MSSEGLIPKRQYTVGVELSILGLGGVVVVGMDQDDANYIVGEAVERGVNYFDVAPSYGDGEAEEKLGIALEPYLDEVFLACKTTCRDGEGARRELERSLERLHAEYFDLYQFHAVKTMEEVEEIFAPGGAMEVFLAAQDEELVDHIGFSAHAVEAALAMMDRFEFDSVLFPILSGSSTRMPYLVDNFDQRLILRNRSRSSSIPLTVRLI